MHDLTCILAGVDVILGTESIDRLVTVHYASPAFSNADCLPLPNSTRTNGTGGSSAGGDRSAGAMREYAATDWVLDPTQQQQQQHGGITTDDTRGFPEVTWSVHAAVPLLVPLATFCVTLRFTNSVQGCLFSTCSAC